MTLSKYISYYFLNRDILYNNLIKGYKLPNIVVVDINMLRLAIYYRVSYKGYIALIITKYRG